MTILEIILVTVIILLMMVGDHFYRKRWYKKGYCDAEEKYGPIDQTWEDAEKEAEELFESKHGSDIDYL